MKRFLLTFALAGSLIGTSAPTVAGQIVQTQNFDQTYVRPVGQLHSHIESPFFFETFPTASAGLGLPATLTSAIWNMQFGVSLGVDAINTSTIEKTIRAEMVVQSFETLYTSTRLFISAFVNDTCGPGEACTGFDFRFPFSRTITDDFLDPYLDSSPFRRVFARFPLVLDPAQDTLGLVGVAQGRFFGSLSLTYEYTVAEPHPIMLLGLALTSLGLVRRRNLH